jgi:hypothetical protein
MRYSEGLGMGRVVVTLLVIGALAWHTVEGCCTHRVAQSPAVATRPVDNRATCACGHRHASSPEGAQLLASGSRPAPGDPRRNDPRRSCPGRHHCSEGECVFAESVPKVAAPELKLTGFLSAVPASLPQHGGEHFTAQADNGLLAPPPCGRRAHLMNCVLLI